MIFDATESLGESFRIAEIASGADLRATSDRVPRAVRPFNRAVIRHIYRYTDIERNENIDAPYCKAMESKLRSLDAWMIDQPLGSSIFKKGTFAFDRGSTGRKNGVR